tara:strand:+ start:9666 stop:10649 length:984 start_codon:yes stop_codon:yes gene_type:complete
MTYSYSYSKKLSTRSNALGLRASYGLSCLAAKGIFSDLSVFTADTATSAGLDRFRTQYQSSFYDVGISEQALIATAAGYVASGGRAVVSTFAPFLTLRAAEQIRLSLGYMNLPLVLAGLASGTALGYLGYTHCCFEDISLMTAIPNILIYTPSDAYELSCVFNDLLSLNRPTYIRLTGASKTQPVHRSDFTTNLNDPIPYHVNGKDLLILSSGVISSNVTSALSQLDDNILDRLSFYTLPFIDQSSGNPLLLSLLAEFSNVLVLDEGGFNGVPSFLNKLIINHSLKINFFYECHPLRYLTCGSHDFMLSQMNLDSHSILRRITSILF